MALEVSGVAGLELFWGLSSIVLVGGSVRSVPLLGGVGRSGTSRFRGRGWRIQD